VESGETLSQGLSRFPKIFSSYVVNMIRAAELSGEMELTMNRVADQLESSAEFKRQMITSLIYPGVVMVMAVVVIAILTLVVIPKFAPLLGENKTLPPVTQSIMDASAWMQAYWWMLAGGAVLTVVSAVLFRRTPEGRYLVDSLLLRVPVVGGILRCGVVVSFSRNLSMLFASGVPLVDALDTVRNTLNNGAAIRVVDAMAERILEGESMSAPLAQAGHIFPSMVAEMVKTGEETGEIVKVLDLTADIFHKMLQTQVKRMNALVEPLLIAVLGSIVGYVFYGLISGMLAVYGL
jgi:type II secretory pathway component PulF